MSRAQSTVVGVTPTIIGASVPIVHPEPTTSFGNRVSGLAETSTWAGDSEHDAHEACREAHWHVRWPYLTLS
jgi:hypothetical protein